MNLRKEVAAGAEDEIEFDAGFFFIGCGEIGHGEFQVGGGGDVEFELLGGRKKRNGHRDPEGTQNTERRESEWADGGLQKIWEPAFELRSFPTRPESSIGHHPGCPQHDKGTESTSQ